jgi:predicted dehydrogenase
VLCEQTVAYTVEECEQVLEAVKKSGKQYMMAENYTYFHYIREWKKMIEAGRLGEIVYAEAEYIHEIVNLLENKEDGSFFWRADRPPIWYCAHCLGPILTLMNDRVIKATGLHSGFHRFPERTDKPGFLDMEVGLFQTEKGKVIKILRSQTPVRPHMVWYTLYGTKGSVENSRFVNNGVLYIKDEMQEEKNAETPEYSTVDPDAPEEAKGGGHGTSEYFMIRDFLESVKNNTRPPIDIIRSIEFTVPGIIAHESALQGGKQMDVPVYSW